MSYGYQLKGMPSRDKESLVASGPILLENVTAAVLLVTELGSADPDFQRLFYRGLKGTRKFIWTKFFLYSSKSRCFYQRIYSNLILERFGEQVGYS